MLKNLPLSAVIVAGLCSPAGANPALERGKEQLQDLRYDKAKSSFRSALKAGGNSADETAEIYRLLGEVHATLGESKAAEESFRNALALDAKTKLADGVSPKIAEPFAAAEKYINKKGRLLAETKIVSASPPKVALVVSSDPTKLIVKVTAAYRIGEAESETTVKARGRKTIEIPLPSGTVGARLTAYDRYGNKVVELGEKALPKVKDSGKKPDGDGDGDGDGGKGGGDELDLTVGDGDGGGGGDGGGQDDRGGGRSFLTHWALYGSLAVVAVGAGTAFGLSARSALDELDQLKVMSAMVQYSDAKKVEDRARSRALLANVSFGVAAALAITSGVLFFTQGDSDDNKERSALVPIVTDESVGVSALFDF